MTAAALVAADAALERGGVPTVAHEGSPVLVAVAVWENYRYLVVIDPREVQWIERHGPAQERLRLRWGRHADWSWLGNWANPRLAFEWLNDTASSTTAPPQTPRPP